MVNTRRHQAECYLDLCLTGGLADLRAWDGITATSIFPLIEWDGLWHASLAWTSVWNGPMDQPAHFGDEFMAKLARLIELSRAYSALKMWQSGSPNPKCITHDEDCGVAEHEIVTRWLEEKYILGTARGHGTYLHLLHHADMVAIDKFLLDRRAATV